MNCVCVGGWRLSTLNFSVVGPCPGNVDTRGTDHWARLCGAGQVMVECDGMGSLLLLRLRLFFLPQLEQKLSEVAYLLLRIAVLSAKIHVKAQPLHIRGPGYPPVRLSPEAMLQTASSIPKGY